MATLEKIRQKGKLVAIVVGFALLAFILTDFIMNSQAIFGGDRTEIANINGESVHFQEFEQQVQELARIQEIQSGGSLDGNMLEGLRVQAWEQMVNQMLLAEEVELLGVRVSPEELYDLVQGENIDPIIAQAFTDPSTGSFNPSSVRTFLQQMDLDQTGNSRAMWTYIERQVYENRLRSKYNSLVQKGILVTNFEAEQAHLENAYTVDFDYVMVPYASVNDSTIAVSDQEIKAYYDENKALFEQEKSREASYVVFKVAPTKADMEASRSAAAEVAENLRQVADVAAFVRASDEGSVLRVYKNGDAPVPFNGMAFDPAAQVGQVFGPVESQELGAYQVMKIVSISQMPDTVRASHILIGGNRSYEQATALLDSIKSVIENGGDFAALAQQYSEDQGSAVNGGDLGWFPQGMMVQPFNDFCFKSPVDSLGVVESQFGLHLIRVTGRGVEQPVRELALVNIQILPTNETIQQVYAEASRFAGSNREFEAFQKAAQEAGLDLRLAENIREMDQRIAGVETGREPVRWIYQAELDAVSDVFEFGEDFAVFALTRINEEGLAPVDDEQVRMQIEAVLRREKLGQQIAQKMSGASLEAIAQTNGAQVVEAKTISFNTFSIPNAGPEPQVVAHAVSLEKGKLSQPIPGNMGVFVINVKSITEPIKKEDYQAEIATLLRGKRGRVPQSVMGMLRDAAELEDKRANFF